MDSDRDSQDEPVTPINLYPETRRPKQERATVTLKSSKLSESPEVTKIDEIEEPIPKRQRQTLIDLSGGTLGTKRPLTNPISRNDPARLSLKDIAIETSELLPGLLATRPDIGTEGFLCRKEDIDSKYSPKLPPIQVRVINADTIDAALEVQQKRSTNYSGKPVIVLNMANARTAGGGWKHGSLAQEEILCYRTSLSRTLKHRFYPIPDDAAIYSPKIMVIRESYANGHGLLDFRDPRKLEVISAVSCAAVQQPRIKRDASGNTSYAVARHKTLMEEKMRVILRTAIRNRHRSIVLGAFGCGVFGNPNALVAKMWSDVLQEPEFQGGWWEDVVFAVLGPSGPRDNFTVFHAELDGLVLR